MPGRITRIMRLTVVPLAMLILSGTAGLINLCPAFAGEPAAGSLSISRSIDFNDIDTDRNGAISRMEAHQLPRLESEFSLVDGNADGWVSRDEFEVFSPRPPGQDFPS